MAESVCVNGACGLTYPGDTLLAIPSHLAGLRLTLILSIALNCMGYLLTDKKLLTQHTPLTFVPMGLTMAQQHRQSVQAKEEPYDVSYFSSF